MNIFVGNMSREVTEDDLREAFEAFGQVTSLEVIKDKHTGDSKGFAFIEMPAKAEARAAIAGMDLQIMKGRGITVNEARPRTERRNNRRGRSRRGR